jgi:signal transduction histidine kinase
VAVAPLSSQLPSVAADPSLEPAIDQVPVIYGAFEPMSTPDGVTYYVRTVDIEGDVRVQGFRLSPGGLRAALHDELTDVQRGYDPFRLTWEPATVPTLASRPLDGVPGVAAVSALLVPDSPTLAAEDEEDRRVVLTLGGLSAAIVVAVLFAFLAMRREMELARRKSDFLSAVSHELRAPVTTIRMYAEMLRDGWVDDASRRGEYESAIVSEGERLSRLVENVLAYSRRERGKPLDLRDGDLAEKVREVAGLERPVFEKAGLALEVEAPETLPWRFDADAVTQILVNLLDNALKHSRDATDRRVSVRLAATPESVRLEVQDRGGGIPAPEQRRIFEAFYRVGNELTRETRGAGLGLALVRRLAQGHRGDVTVHSEPGKGATFTVRLGRISRDRIEA